MSVEDIERNIRNQQIQKTEQAKQQTTPQHQRQNEQQQLPFPPGIAPPPGLTGNKNSIFPQHVQSQQQRPNVVGSAQTPGTSRIPPGFPMNMLPPHMNAQQAAQLHQNLARMQSNLPHPMNNFQVSTSLRTFRTKKNHKSNIELLY